jgi:glycosyltransferase involved in cell wall biosynthesis
MPLLSIIIPVYNVESYLRRCLDHVYCQIDNCCEVIMIDDGSKDMSGYICDEYQAKYPFLTTVFHKKNEGAGATRNMLLDKANGEYVWFVDSDDYIEDGSIAKIIEVLDNHEYLEILSMCYKRFSNTTYHDLENIPHKEAIITGEEYLINEKVDGFLWNKIYNLQFLRNNKIRFNNINSQEDWLFNIRAFLACNRMMLTSLYTYNYFQDNQNSTLHNKSWEHCLKNISNSMEAQKELQQIIDHHRESKSCPSLMNILNLTLSGFLYSLYLSYVPLKMIREILMDLKRNNLYPVRKTDNKRANLFILGANMKWIYLMICWLHIKMRKNR